MIRHVYVIMVPHISNKLLYEAIYPEWSLYQNNYRFTLPLYLSYINTEIKLFFSTRGAVFVVSYLSLEMIHPIVYHVNMV